MNKFEERVDTYFNDKLVFDLSTLPIDNDMICNWDSPLDNIYNKKHQKIFIMRHGERVDFTFGRNWLESCFDKFECYTRKDLNLPKTLPHRVNYQNWINDSPITKIGMHQAYLTGEAMKNRGVEIQYAYCSPSFRCVQTCNAWLEGLGLRDSIKIRIEPGLYEWLGFFTDVPDWCTPIELSEYNFNVDLSYTSLLTRENLRKVLNETIEDHYERHFSIIQKILHQVNGKNMLISAHGGSLDSCSRQLIGEKPRSMFELTKVGRGIPYCSVATVEKYAGLWKLVKPPCLTVTHSTNPRFSASTFSSRSSARNLAAQL